MKNKNNKIEQEDDWMQALYAQTRTTHPDDYEYQRYKNLWAAVLWQRLVDLLVYLPRKKRKINQQHINFIDWKEIDNCDISNWQQPKKIDPEMFMNCNRAVAWFEGEQYKITKELLDIDNTKIDNRIKNIILAVKPDLEKKRERLFAQNNQNESEI